MEVTFWGTRGSIAKAGPTTVRYGGNTSCVAVRSDDGTIVVIDCGTGAHGLGQHLVAEAGGDPLGGHILVSHTHWDHIQGLPFFSPLFQPGSEWDIYGPKGMVSSLSEILAGQMDYSYFPISVDHLEAKTRYHDLVEGGFAAGEVRVESHYLNHPALTLGYRLEVDGAVVVYASDHEPHDHGLAQGGNIAEDRHDSAHADFITGADLLIHDAQFLAEEYPERVGWGHSTVEYVIDVAATAGVGTVALFHHDPSRTDALMEELLDTARAHARAVGYEGHVIAAREGDTIEVRGESGGDPSRWASLPSAISMAEVGTRSAVVVAETAEVASVISEEARAERLDVALESDLRLAFETVQTRRPGIIVVEAVDDDGGFDIVEAIRALPEPYGPEVPIILVGTASARRRADAAETGITEWIVWPAKGFFIRTKMRAWLMRRAEEEEAAGPTED